MISVVNSYLELERLTMDCEIRIDDALAGKLSPADLLRPISTLAFTIITQGTERWGRVFTASANGFHFELSIQRGRLILERNGQRAIAPFDPSRVGKWQMFAQWTPSVIETSCTYLEKGCRVQLVSVQTPPTMAPPVLIQYAKSLKLGISNEFSSAEEFRGHVHQVIADVIDGLQVSGAHESLWDKSYSGGHLVGVRPKRETDLHPLISWHLRDWADLRGIQIIPEAQNAVGRLDFALQAYIAGSGIETFCLEFKQAHAADLTHGIDVQLPAYMERYRSKYGAYVVLWFKGGRFRQPGSRRIRSISKTVGLRLDEQTAEQTQLLMILNAHLIKSQRQGIRVFILDATAPVPASRA